MSGKIIIYDNIAFCNIRDDGSHINQGGAKRFARNIKNMENTGRVKTKSQCNVRKQINRGLRIASLNMVS